MCIAGIEMHLHLHLFTTKWYFFQTNSKLMHVNLQLYNTNKITAHSVVTNCFQCCTNVTATLFCSNIVHSKRFDLQLSNYF